MNGAELSSEQAEGMSFNSHFAHPRCSSWEKISVARVLCQTFLSKEKISKKTLSMRRLITDSRIKANKLRGLRVSIADKLDRTQYFKNHSTTCQMTTRRFVSTVAKSQNLLESEIFYTMLNWMKCVFARDWPGWVGVKKEPMVSLLCLA